KEAGLEPLAELLLTQPQNKPELVAADFVDAEKQVPDVAAALDGARAILVERFAEDADLIGKLREEMWSNGQMVSTVRKGKKTEGVRVFASNLRDLLLAAPAGARVTMGLDPGFRSGVKVAIVDATGKVVATTAVYPHEPQKQWDAALATLGKLAVTHRVDLIA